MLRTVPGGEGSTFVGADNIRLEAAAPVELGTAFVALASLAMVEAVAMVGPPDNGSRMTVPRLFRGRVEHWCGDSHTQFIAD